MRRLIGFVALVCVGCGGSGDDTTGGGVEQTGGSSATGGVAGAAGAGGGAKGTGGMGNGGHVGGGGSVGSGGASGSGGSGGKAASGGTTNTGGTLGSGGAPPGDAGPPVVLPCSSLPGAPQWEEITPTDDTKTCATDADCTNAGMDCTHCVHASCDYGDSQAVVVHPLQSGTLYVDMHRCNNGNHRSTDGLYRSSDCGATWNKVSTGRNADAVSTGSWASMAIDFVDPSVIYTVDIYGTGGLWKSTNGGVDWDQMVPQTVDQYIHSMFFDSVSMDPTDPRHLVVGTHQNCAAPYDPSCEVETTDGGATWTIARLPVGWGETAGPWVVDASSWLFGGGALLLTTDHGATWTDVTPTGAMYFDGGEAENHPIHRGADGTYYLASGSGVVRSNDGHAWSLIPNSGGRTVGLTIGGGRLYTSDQWTSAYHTASASDPTVWSVVPPPPAPGNGGAPYLDFDEGHHILYSSNFAGGLWRRVMQ